MHRIVLFGLDGSYATIPLQALAAGGLRPELVVVGRDRTPGALRGTTTIHHAKPGVLERMQAKLTRGAASSAPRGPDQEHDLTSAAHRLGIDVVETDNANSWRALSAIESVKPDAFVVAGFPHLFASDLLAVPRVGGINIHPGRLPEERGPSPLFWSLSEGRTTLTVTLHVLDEGEDTGDVVATTEVGFEPGTSGTQILMHCGHAAAPLLVRSMRSLLAGDLVRQPQPPPKSKRRRRPRFRDGRLDASRTAEEVFTFVSACADRYSLFAECGGDRFFVQRAISYDLWATCDFEFVLMGDRLIFRCAQGVVELELKEDGALFTAEYVDDDGPQRLLPPSHR